MTTDSTEGWIQVGLPSDTDTHVMHAAGPYDSQDTRFKPLDVAELDSLFGLGDDGKPGWALHWSRDYNADTSDADNRPAPKPLKWVGSIG